MAISSLRDSLLIDQGRLANRFLLPCFSVQGIRTLFKVFPKQAKLFDRINMLKERIDTYNGEISWEDIEYYEKTILRRQMTSEEAQSVSSSIRSFKANFHRPLPERALVFINPRFIEKLPEMNEGQSLEFLSRLFEGADKLISIDHEQYCDDSFRLSKPPIHLIQALENKSPQLKATPIPLHTPLSTIIAFLRNHPNLETVALTPNASLRIGTNQVLLALSEHCQRLNTLIIFQPPSNIAEGLTAVGIQCNITTLVVDGGHLNAGDIEAISRNYPNLKTFSMKGARLNPSTPLNTLELLSNLNQLEELDLESAGITDQMLASLRAPNLRSLCIRHCDQISDVGLAHIGQNCPRLEKIYLPYHGWRDGRQLITRAGLKALFRNIPSLNFADFFLMDIGFNQMTRRSFFSAIQQKEIREESLRMFKTAATIAVLAIAIQLIY